MEKKASQSIQEILSVLQDPRHSKNKRHLLQDILVISFCALLSGAEGFTDFENFGKSKIDFFKKFLVLPHGIPSHDVFGKVFALLDSKALQQCFQEWMISIRQAFQLDSISIDGKTLRGSKSKNNDALQMVSAWACEVGLVLGQIKVKSGSNEIPAIEDILEILDLNGCVVTIDAIGTQTAITKKIIEKGGDYILSAKDNQPKFAEAVRDY